VRLVCFRSFPAGEWSKTRRFLFARREATLPQVFDARVAYSNFDRPTGNETSSSAMLSVEKGLEEGHHRSSLRTTIKTVSIEREEGIAPGEKTEQTLFFWCRERYVPTEAR